MKSSLKKITKLASKFRIKSAAKFNTFICLSLTAVVLAISGGPGVKNAVFTQDDWSGGQGSGANQYQSADKVITSNAGEVSAESTPNPDSNAWCNVSSPTDYCDNSWKKREPITISNSAGTQTDTLVRLAIPARPAMADDMRDLRFTNEAGTTGYTFYTSHWITDSKAYVWVKIPSLSSGSTNIYAYYGNPAATTVSDISVMYWADNFHSGPTVDPTYWSADGETITDGEAVSLNHPHMTAPGGTGWDTTQTDYTFQYDVRMIDSYCDGGGVFTDGLESGWPSYQSSAIKVVDINCGSRKFNFAIATDGLSGSYVSQPYFFDFGSRVSIRTKSYTTGGYDYYYSIDDGKTFTQFESYTRNNAQPVNGDALFFNPSPLNGIASNMTVIPTQPDYSYTIGDEQGSDWCNTANCNSSWPMRRELNIKNYGDTDLTDYPVRVDFKAEFDVNDFSDLRFTDASGAHDLDYWVERTDGNLQTPTASIWVKIPNLALGINKVYLYHNKQGVSSLSNSDNIMIMNDQFSTGALANFWDDKGHPEVLTVDGGAASVTIEGVDNTYGINYSVASGREYTVAMTYDVKLDVNNLNCNLGSNCISGYTAFGDSSTITYAYHRSNDDSDNYWYVTALADRTNEGWFSEQNTPLKFQNNEYVTFKAVMSASGGNDYYFSTDQGRTFTVMNGYNRNSSNDQSPYFGTGNWGKNERVTYRNILIHKYSNSVGATKLGAVEHTDGHNGTLTSNIIDVGEKPILGNVHFGQTGNGYAVLKLKSSPNVDMSGSEEFSMCNVLADNQSAYDSNCINKTDRYLQYQLVLPATSDLSLKVTSVSIDYDNDNLAPNVPANLVIQKDTGSPPKIVTAGSWTNSSRPYLTWDAATDNGPSGIKAYCLYFGDSDTAEPLSTSGNLKPYTYGGDYTGIDIGGACQYATNQTELNTALDNVFHFDLQSGSTYYLRIKTIDNMDNISTDVAQTSFKLDTSNPAAQTIASIPSAAGSKIFHVSWLTGPLVFYGDEDSGFAGMKYCLSPVYTGGTGCNPDDTNWYGSSHTSGSLYDSTDVINFEDGGFDTVPADADRLDNQIALANFVRIVAVDFAGNYQDVGTGVIVLTQMPAAPAENLQVSPSSNTQNAFSFTWDQPLFSLGSRAQLEYCWTVNEVIATDGRNCNWTGRNVYSLAQNAYATQQGVNTLRLMTKDITGNFDSTQFATATFTATTTAPGIPRDLESSDASTRATRTWKIALSWNAPTLPGSGINKYRIYRSSDNVSFTEVGSTASNNTGFVDTGLDQVDYYYYIKACDNANSCSAPSSTVTRKPTGRYTTPPRLTADTDQPKIDDIGTKKATVFWFTDRDSDSKVAFGTKPGEYFPEEVGNSTQTGNHSVKLTNLQPATKYYYITRWTDSDGNTGVSEEKSFTTLPAPTISEVEPKNVSVTAATIAFRSKDASKVNLYFGKGDGLGGFQTINTATRESSYSIPLSQLDDGTKYTFKLNGVDSDGNEFAGNSYNFTTPARPKISNLRFQPVAGAPSSTQKVSWTTNVPSTSSLKYGPQGAKQADLLDSKLVTEHEVTISDLLDSTTYSLVAQSVDSAGNTATSDSQVFTTALDTRAPKITNFTIENSIRGTGVEARGQVILSWTTDEPATSQVVYGKGQSGTLTSSTGEDTRLTKNHVVVVSDLPVSSIYRLQPVSFDKARNTTKGSIQTVVVGRGSDNVFGIILSALQKIFGI